MQEGQLLTTQVERDRLVALRKAEKEIITQKQAGVKPADRREGGTRGDQDHVQRSVSRLRTNAGVGVFARQARNRRQ